MRLGRVPCLLLLALAAGCGKNRDLPATSAIDPSVYEIEPGDVPGNGQYLRYVAPGERGGGLDVASTDFAPPGDGPSVHLVGVVHIADEDYYARVQRELDGYDTVLYEGILEAADVGAEWQRTMLDDGGTAGQMQIEVAAWFGFRYQLAALDYSRPNLLHADMTMEEFAEAGAAKFGLVANDDDNLPEKFAATWARIKALGRVVLGVPGPIQSLARKELAAALGTTDIGASLALTPGLSELLLDKRNAVVMRRLDERLAETAAGRIAIFYGAAHMDDLARQVEARGYRRTAGHWLRAWGLRPPLRGG